MSASLEDTVAGLLGARVERCEAVAGGDLNDAFRLELAGGRQVFAKTSPDAAPGAFVAEAAGLRWLAEPSALALPAVLGVDERVLVLEWVTEERRAHDFGELLGRGLAALHGAGAERFGATGEQDPSATIIGPLALPNDEHADWAAFYAACRLEPVARIAAKRGALPDGTAAALDRLAERLPELLGPPEPPARLHGDLWSGNVMAGPGGAPWLIDPAAYGGHREIDLAMLELFGAPAGARDAYHEVAPLADGHEARVPLHQLFPLLVHAALFGGGYGARARSIVQRFV